MHSVVCESVMHFFVQNKHRLTRETNKTNNSNDTNDTKIKSENTHIHIFTSTFALHLTIIFHTEERVSESENTI